MPEGVPMTQKRKIIREATVAVNPVVIDDSYRECRIKPIKREGAPVTPQPHCDHECVCPAVSGIMRSRNDVCEVYACPNDTRSRPAAPDGLAMLEEWDYLNIRNFLTPHPVFRDMIRMVREKPDAVQKHIAELRKSTEAQR